MPASYHGKTHLFVANRGAVVQGDIYVETDPSGRSEIRIRNDSCNVERVLKFASQEVRDCIKQFIEACWEVHHQVEVPVFVDTLAPAPTCIGCRGEKQVCDREGNCTRCAQCA